MSRMHFWQINCRNLKDATNLLNLFQKCSTSVTLDSIWDNAVRCLRVGYGIDEEGWTVVASLVKFLKYHGEEGRYHNVYASRSAMLRGRREDLKIVWRGVLDFWCVNDPPGSSKGSLLFKHHSVEGPSGWKMIETILDMSEDQWQAYDYFGEQEKLNWMETSDEEEEED